MDVRTATTADALAVERLRVRDGEAAVELSALCVDPGRWRSGVGTAVRAACEGVTVLWVLEGWVLEGWVLEGWVLDGGRQELDLDGPTGEMMRRG